MPGSFRFTSKVVGHEFVFLLQTQNSNIVCE